MNLNPTERYVNGLFSRTRKINMIGRWARNNVKLYNVRVQTCRNNTFALSSGFGLSSFKLQPTPTSISHTLSRKLSGRAKSPEDALLHLDRLELQPVSLLQSSEGPNRQPWKTLDIRHRAY